MIIPSDDGAERELITGHDAREKVSGNDTYGHCTNAGLSGTGYGGDVG